METMPHMQSHMVKDLIERMHKFDHDLADIIKQLVKRITDFLPAILSTVPPESDIGTRVTLNNDAVREWTLKMTALHVLLRRVILDFSTLLFHSAAAEIPYRNIKDVSPEGEMLENSPTELAIKMAIKYHGFSNEGFYAKSIPGIEFIADQKPLPPEADNSIVQEILKELPRFDEYVRSLSVSRIVSEVANLSSIVNRTPEEHDSYIKSTYGGLASVSILKKDGVVRCTCAYCEKFKISGNEIVFEELNPIQQSLFKLVKG